MTTEFPPLETACTDCNGKGRIAARREGTTYYEGGTCNKCLGAGALPTAAGKAVLAFLVKQKRAGNL